MLEILLSFCAWMLVFSSLWKTWKMIKNNLTYLKRIHRIPCVNCVYFTGDYRLKCTVHPHKALTEEALNCQDFESKNSPMMSYKSELFGSRW
jgi:hypothetical protein